MFSQQEFNKFVEENGVYGFFDEPIKLVSGRMSHFYVNWRDVTKDVWLADKLTDYIIEFAKDNNVEVDTFYGVPEAATKLGLLTQYKWAKMSGKLKKGSHALAMGRKVPKDHGMPKDKFFVGMPEGKVVIVEDLVTVATNLMPVIDNLKSAGVDLSAVIVLSDRKEKRDDGMSVKEAVEAKGVKFFSMSSAPELLPIMYEKMQPGEEIGRKVEEYYEKYGIENLWMVKKDLIADRLLDKIDEKKNPCVVGLDPFFERIPKHLVKGNSIKDAADAIRKFNFEIIDNIYDLVPAVKLQMACYEQYGAEGLAAFKDTVSYARSKGLIVLEDGKRNDISSTVQAYANGHLGEVKTQNSRVPSLDVDFLTVSPYLGSDGLKPFVDVCKRYGKGIFILAKTSNPGSGEFQDRLVEATKEEAEELEKMGIECDKNRTELYNLVALQVNRYAQEYKGVRGYSSIGAVVGASYSEQAQVLRKIMPDSIFLVPGYGAQGGSAQDLTDCFNDDGYGAVVNSSRGIIFAYEKYEGGNPEKFAEAAREATEKMVKDIRVALKEAGKLPSKWE